MTNITNLDWAIIGTLIFGVVYFSGWMLYIKYFKKTDEELEDV